MNKNRLLYEKNNNDTKHDLESCRQTDNSYLQFHILGKIQLYFTNNNVIHQNELLQILTFNHEVSRVYSQLEWTTAPLCFHLVVKNRIASKR